MPLGHFGTNRAIMLTNTRNIKTNAALGTGRHRHKTGSCQSTADGIIQNFRQEIKKNVTSTYNLSKNNVYLHFK